MKTHLYKDDILKICHKGHLTVEEIYEKILKLYESVSKSSIYRNIENMVKNGELRKLEGIGKKAYFETNIGEHIHLIDQNNGKIIDINMNNIDLSLLKLPKNFKTNSLDIKIFGEFS